MSERNINPNSLANLNPQARAMGKVRRNTTLLPETITWLERIGGNVSQGIEDLVAAAKAGQLRSVTDDSPQPDEVARLKEALEVEHQAALAREEEFQQLKTELTRCQQLLDDSGQAGDLPPAADILNQLRKRPRRSAVTLRDVEAILEIIDSLS